MKVIDEEQTQRLTGSKRGLCTPLVCYDQLKTLDSMCPDQTIKYDLQITSVEKQNDRFISQE